MDDAEPRGSDHLERRTCGSFASPKPHALYHLDTHRGDTPQLPAGDGSGRPACSSATSAATTASRPR
jgi:hypothetical protein